MAVMKKITRILAVALAAALAIACGKKDKSISIDGEWELVNVEFATRSAVVGSETVTVYMSFDRNGTFAMYQQLGEGRFRQFAGTWSLSGDIVPGQYSDGKSWGTSYRVSRDGDTLLMVSSPDETDSYTYRKCTIPESVKK